MDLARVYGETGPPEASQLDDLGQRGVTAGGDGCRRSSDRKENRNLALAILLPI